MTRDAVIETIENLAMSQGMYGRMLKFLEELQESDPNRYNGIMMGLESCSDPVELVMMIEG